MKLLGSLSTCFSLAYLGDRLHMPVGRRGHGLLIVALLGLTVMLAACNSIKDTSVQKPASAATSDLDGRLTALANLDIPLLATTTQTTTTALVITKGVKANIRSGPGMGFPVFAKANPGDVFDVAGKSEDKKWWQVCCVKGAGDAGQGEPGWMSGTVVKVQGAPESVATVAGVLRDDLTAQWAVNWSCVSTSQNCKVPKCTATVDAKSAGASQQPWQKVNYSVNWDKSCASLMDTPAWTFEVNKYSGQERTQTYRSDLLYNYWAGAQPDAATHVFTMDDGREVVVHCSGPQTKEVAEQGGWITVYEGEACHDIRTGMLVTLSYTKKWLYSGKLGDQTYERAYFGDTESLEQHLADSNADLYFEK